jgi:hypothetical protein
MKKINIIFYFNSVIIWISAPYLEFTPMIPMKGIPPFIPFLDTFYSCTALLI